MLHQILRPDLGHEGGSFVSSHRVPDHVYQGMKRLKCWHQESRCLAAETYATSAAAILLGLPTFLSFIS